MRPDDNTEHRPTPATSTTTTVSGSEDRHGTDRHDAGGLPPIPDDERDDARRRWDDIEARFVDDPAGATASADDLLTETVDRLRSRWDDHRAGLREAWDRDDASTEELRTTLKRYRAALEDLLAR